jgi:hypothetical protein
MPPEPDLDPTPKERRGRAVPLTSTSTQWQYMLAIDPGGTTGYCHGVFDGDKLQLKPGQEKFSEAQLFAFMHEHWQKNFYLIYEKFSYRNRARPGLDLTAPKLIGVIELFVQSEGIQYFPQMAAEAMGYWTDEQLKRFNVYVKGLQHGRDAMRHLLQWWQFKYGYKFHQTSPFTKYEIVEGR